MRYRSQESIQAWRVVPPASDRVSRARPYSGTSAGVHPRVRLRGCNPVPPALPCRSAPLDGPAGTRLRAGALQPPAAVWAGARPLAGLAIGPLSLAAIRNLASWFFSSGYLDVSVPRLSSPKVCVPQGMPGPLLAGSPIRRPAGREGVSPPNRGLSQLAASFIGFLCQGIRRAPTYLPRIIRAGGAANSLMARRPLSGGAIMGVAYRRAARAYRADQMLSLLQLSLQRRRAASGVGGGSMIENRSDQMLNLMRSLCGSQRYAGASPRGPDMRAARREDRPDGFSSSRRLRVGYSSWKMLLPIEEGGVFRPHVPVRLPYSDFTLTLHAFDASPLGRLGRQLQVPRRRLRWCDGRCVQARERIHRGVLIAITGNSDFMGRVAANRTGVARSLRLLSHPAVPAIVRSLAGA